LIGRVRSDPDRGKRAVEAAAPPAPGPDLPELVRATAVPAKTPEKPEPGRYFWPGEREKMLAHLRMEIGAAEFTAAPEAELIRLGT